MALPDPRSILPTRLAEIVPPRSQMQASTPAPGRSVANEHEDRLRQITGLAVKQIVYERRLSTQQGVASDAFAWPREGPLAVYMENTQDVEVTVDIHGNMSDDTSRPLKTPLKSFTIGPNERRLENVNSDAGDKWAPYVWAQMMPTGVATIGAMRITMARPGV